MPAVDTMKPARTYLAGELAVHLGATLKGDPNVEIRGISSLEDAREHQLSFLTDARYLSLLPQCKAAALIVPSSFKEIDFTVLISDRPYLALARAAKLFEPPLPVQAGVHAKAHVEEDVQVGAGVSIGPFTTIGWGSRIGSRTALFGHVYVGRNVTIGEDCKIFPGVVILDDCRIGDRVIIHGGTVIGSDGFGFAQDESGHHVKIPQMGIVQVDDDVEIGANCTIDRATFGKTWIQRGSKIDNLVQIAHNVVVGEHSILVAQVGISGSSRLGKGVILAGQVGVVGHITIGDGARVGAQSGVAHSVKAREDVSGSPAVPHKEWLRNCVNIRRLSQYRVDLRNLKERVRRLEEALATSQGSGEESGSPPKG